MLNFGFMLQNVHTMANTIYIYICYMYYIDERQTKNYNKNQIN